ncbi:MAG: hypothetical protein N6V49_08245, partial [Serratia symbiotica]|nr:hypothetical protein [Serratia symbiotica]
HEPACRFCISRLQCDPVNSLYRLAWSVRGGPRRGVEQCLVIRIPSYHRLSGCSISIRHCLLPSATG